MPTATLTADAVVAPLRITADAWIADERWRHHRIRDHMGAESDLYVVLSERIGPYEMYTPIHWVIDDMVTRILALESGNKVLNLSFVADAWIAVSGTYQRGNWVVDAVIGKSQSGSFKADAVLSRGGAITADAVIMPSFTADAFIV